MGFKCFLCILPLFLLTSADNVGWKSFLTESPAEFHDLPLEWETGNMTKVPNWLSGVFVRNGPSQHTFGSPRRHLGSWLDGFAKLNSFKLDGNKVYFSGKMVESSTYMDSVAKGELVPQITLNPLANPDEEWNLLEMEEIMERSFNQWYGDASHGAYDNNNPGVWRFGPRDDPQFLVTTDYPFPQRFDIDTLDTMEIFIPDNAGSTRTGITHWMRQPNTDNSITGQYKAGNILSSDYFEVQRFTPDNLDYSKPEVIGKFYPKKASMVHSFSVTENHVIFFFYPVVNAGPTCALMHHFHALDCMSRVNEPTDIYIVNFNSGEVTELQAEVVFSQHHINAYETPDGNEIIMDISPSDDFGLRDFVAFENMLNPPEISQGLNGSTCGNEELTRYRINLKEGTVEGSTFPNGINSVLARYVNKFDFPTINEAYRGKEYCITYGWSAFDYSRTALVKKNVCDYTQDKVIYTENHYASEMFFIANPEAKSEDDGVLVSITFDGEKEQSYFVVIDAITFTEIDRAYLPHNIPWSAHGMHFPEAKWTLNG